MVYTGTNLNALPLHEFCLYTESPAERIGRFPWLLQIRENNVHLSWSGNVPTLGIPRLCLEPNKPAALFRSKVDGWSRERYEAHTSKQRQP